MTQNLPSAFNNSYNQVATEFGQYSVVYRPPSSEVVNQTPVAVASTMIFAHTGGEKWAIPRMTGVPYFTVTGDRSLFKPGDIIIPVSSTTNVPPITILNYDFGKPCIGFRTSRICNITLDLNTIVYSNVYFEHISPSIPAEGLIEDLSGAVGIQRKKLCVFTRIGYQPQFQNYEIAGMRIVAADGTIPIRYVVRGLSQIGNLTVFSVDQELT